MVVTVSDKASCYKSSRTPDCGETLGLGLDPDLYPDLYLDLGPDLDLHPYLYLDLTVAKV